VPDLRQPLRDAKRLHEFDAVGGMVGAMIKEGVPEDEANFYAEGVRYFSPREHSSIAPISQGCHSGLELFHAFGVKQFSSAEVNEDR